MIRVAAIEKPSVLAPILWNARYDISNTERVALGSDVMICFDPIERRHI
jgi:hypothetical protein